MQQDDTARTELVLTCPDDGTAPETYRMDLIDAGVAVIQAAFKVEIGLSCDFDGDDKSHMYVLAGLLKDLTLARGKPQADGQLRLDLRGKPVGEYAQSGCLTIFWLVQEIVNQQEPDNDAHLRLSLDRLLGLQAQLLRYTTHNRSA